MCGIFGYSGINSSLLSLQQVQTMGEVINYRGPDGCGIYYDKDDAIALGNQRLAILDLAHGQQPFVSDDENIIVVQNGEIFNHVELAQELNKDGYRCKTHCDTEVILRLYERDGISGISKLNGMFAIAIYDKNEGALYLVRDRAGEKPLYYSHDEQFFLFASEIKSLLKIKKDKALHPDALNQFMAFNYVPPPLTMFKDIYHVMPGHWIKIAGNKVEQHCWWDLSSVCTEVKKEEEWIEQFNYILNDAVDIRLRADVPFGAFLSGGVDSSTVVGLMSRHLDSTVKTFCIGFDDPKYDESPFALFAAKRFKTDHTMHKVAANLIELWPMATYHCDQPHGDVSFLPTYKVAELAAEHVKMVLTGDGADELFAGYDKYKNFFSRNKNITDQAFRTLYLDNISLFNLDSRNQLFSDNIQVQMDSLDVHSVLEPLYQKAQGMDLINQALYIDTMLLLPGNNLVKPDRMGMAVSIENRSPFLDYRMIEMAFSMPGELKLKNGETKYLYKKAVAPLIGKELTYRKKQMFTVPVGDWFKTRLADLCDDLLKSEKTIARGIFNYDYVSQLLDNHRADRQNNTREIRALMAVEIWFREVMDDKVEKTTDIF